METTSSKEMGFLDTTQMARVARNTNVEDLQQPPAQKQPFRDVSDQPENGGCRYAPVQCLQVVNPGTLYSEEELRRYVNRHRETALTALLKGTGLYVPGPREGWKLGLVGWCLITVPKALVYRFVKMIERFLQKAAGIPSNNFRVCSYEDYRMMARRWKEKT